MDNIEAKKIESGITVNTAKKVKISNWNELVKNSKELAANINFNKVDDQRNLDFESEKKWNLVSISDSVALNNSSRRIRIIGSGVEQARKSWDNYRQVNNKVDNFEEEVSTNIINNEEEVPTNIIDNEEEFTNYSNISDGLENFGYTTDFSKTVEDVVEQPNFEVPHFEVPRFDEYEKEETKTYEVPEKSVDYSEIEHMAEEAIKQVKNNEKIEMEQQENDEVSYNDIEDIARNYLDKPEKTGEENIVTPSNLQINDLMEEITKLSEVNDHLKGSIATIENRNDKIKMSINGIEKETKNYEEMSLRNAKEILMRTREEQEELRRREEIAINTGKDLKDRLISADEANLSAKKRNDYLADMLSYDNYSESYESEVAYRKVA